MCTPAFWDIVAAADAALVLTVGQQHDGRRAPVPDIGQIAVLANSDRRACDCAQRTENRRRQRGPTGSPKPLHRRLRRGAILTWLRRGQRTLVESDDADVDAVRLRVDERLGCLLCGR